MALSSLLPYIHTACIICETVISELNVKNTQASLRMSIEKTRVVCDLFEENGPITVGDSKFELVNENKWFEAKHLT